MEAEYRDKPTLIIAADTIIGLTVLRSLGRRDVPVYCAYTTSDALGPHSRYCRGSIRLPDDPAKAIAAVDEYAKRQGVTHLLAISENHITLLNRYRATLAKGYTLLFPPQEVFERAVRKDLTLECARRLGVPAPQTAYPQSMEELESCRAFEFPVILKPVSQQWTPGKQPEFRHKYLRVESFDDLWRILRGLPAGQFPMVQEYIPGSGIGVSMLMRGGKAILAFQHRRIREFPPDGGIGVMCESVAPEPQLRDDAEALLKEMNWDGVAMVEYRRDSTTGRYALMEVNGRFWGSLPTAIHAGMDFPFWLYRTSFPDEATPTPEYRAGLSARSLAGDTKWLLSVLRERKRPAVAAIVAYLSAFRPSTKYFMWAWDDPKPAISNFIGRFRPQRP